MAVGEIDVAGDGSGIAQDVLAAIAILRFPADNVASDYPAVDDLEAGPVVGIGLDGHIG